MPVTVVPLDATKRNDFYRVHCDANEAGWCSCVAWWIPTWDRWTERTAEENRNQREQFFEAGLYDGYLLYVDGSPIGWCQCGPRDRFTKLYARYELSPDPMVWAITCFLIVPHQRGHGLVHHLLQSALDDLQHCGIRHVQGFPRRGENLPVDDIWTGPERVFQRVGFSVERDHPQFPVYGIWLHHGHTWG